MKVLEKETVEQVIRDVEKEKVEELSGEIIVESVGYGRQELIPT